MDVTGWAGLELIEPLAGGARNEVVLARRGGRRLVVRRSGRSVAALEWELDLLAHLAAHGVSVPSVIPADDGRRHVDGVLVQTFVDGTAPRTAADWRGVVAVLQRLHAVTRGWPQRPDFASSRRLSTVDRGGDVCLAAMPAAAVRAVRAAWHPILAGAECVVHGDVGERNILVDGSRVTLIDWDESRVDVPWFDFAFLPADVPLSLPVPWDAVVTAGIAWEAATCWVAEPVYAARRLAELTRRMGGDS